MAAADSALPEVSAAQVTTCAMSARWKSSTGCSGYFRFSHTTRTTHHFTQIGGRIVLDDKTTRKYVTVLEQLFIVRRVEPWSRNRLKRLVKTPKLHFLDSRLLAATLGATTERKTVPFSVRCWKLLPYSK